MVAGGLSQKVPTLSTEGSNVTTVMDEIGAIAGELRGAVSELSDARQRLLGWSWGQCF